MKLNAAEWARVEALYPQAAELAGADRERFLDRECGAEVRVRAEIEAMLEAASRDGDELAPGISLSSSERGERMADLLLPGTRLGSWRVKGLIGQGGMGEVYLAERADGAYSMNAAIKLLKRELFTFNNAQRFLRERRVLARLSHPNIARVLDAGTTDDGRPYLVMEYVNGARITDFARSRELAPRDAVRLMLDVAEAVAEAHRKNVVHRDLKPANVLVTDEQQVKLLDFGIAKLMDEDDSTGPHGPLPMTPAYAAPEQILGHALSPTTDVYALGVMLFQLLTHRLPHLREGLPLPVIAAGLRDETVDRPSTVVLGSSGLFGESRRRKQAQELAGDLDWIALKALDNNGAERYATAAEFADDLRRYLEHRPVRARQQSVVYRTGRFVRRYPTQVAATAFAIVALSLGLAAALWQARLASSEAQRTERVKEFVLSVFREQDPYQRMQANALAPGELVARGIARAGEQLADEPRLLSQVLGDLGELQAHLGRAEEARQTLERALDLQGRVGDDLARAKLLRQLSAVLRDTSQLEQAHVRAEEALALLHRNGEGGSVEAARVEMQLGFIEGYGKEQLESTLRHFSTAQRILERKLGPDHPDTIGAIFLRGQALEQARRDQEAKAALADAIRRIESSAGPESAQLIWPLNALVRVEKRAGELDEATPLAARAVTLARRHFGPVHISTAAALRTQADIAQLQRRFDSAEAQLKEAAAAVPPDAEDQKAEILKDLGQLHLEMQRYAEAEQELAGSFEINRRVLGGKNGFTWYVASERGQALLHLNRPAEAEAVQREALGHIETIMGKDAYQVCLVADALATTLVARNKLTEAVALRRRALELTLKRYPETHRLAAVRAAYLARDLYALQPASPELPGLLDRAIGVLKDTESPPKAFGEALVVRGRVHAKAGELASARDAWTEAEAYFRKSPDLAAELFQVRALLQGLKQS